MISERSLDITKPANFNRRPFGNISSSLSVTIVGRNKIGRIRFWERIQKIFRRIPYFRF
jgi:hypothetical protein